MRSTYITKYSTLASIVEILIESIENKYAKTQSLLNIVTIFDLSFPSRSENFKKIICMLNVQIRMQIVVNQSLDRNPTSINN